MLYSKGETEIEPFVQPLGSAGYPIDAEAGEGYHSPSDSDSVKRIPLKLHGDGAPVTGRGKGWGKPADHVGNFGAARGAIFSVSSMQADPKAKAKPAAKPPPAITTIDSDDSDDYDPSDEPESSEETPEDPRHHYDNVVVPNFLKLQEQEKKARGEPHLNELQQKNALLGLKMLEDAKQEKKGNASELQHKSSSSK